MNINTWPELVFAEIKESIETLQLWSQIIGKLRLIHMPWINHSWHVTLYVSSSGLTTGPIPARGQLFELEFNFIKHQLIIHTSSGQFASLDLYPRSVADFYAELMKRLTEMRIDTHIYSRPNEIEPAVPFEQDLNIRSYDKQVVHAFWQALTKIHIVFTQFRAGFTGKTSPVHLFWGAFDLAVTRFSGRSAPPHPGGMPNIPLDVMQEAYSHEVSSAGFWPGSLDFPQPSFYSYCYPTPADFGKQDVKPSEAFYSEEMGEYFLSYDTVRKSDDPDGMLFSFLESTYLAAANTGHWDKEQLKFSFR